MMRTIVSLIALIAAAGIFFGYTKPAYDASGIVKGKIAEYDAALEKAALLQKRKQELLARFTSFNPADIERLQKLLPDHVDNVRLILDLDNLASKHGLSLQNVAVSAPQVQSAEPAAGSISSSKQRYDSLTLKFATVASYDKFLQLMADLESSLRIVDLVSLRFSPAGDSRTSLLYNYEITIRTYWLK